MAKQIEDRVTMELPIPDVPKKRGRPPKLRALSSAERTRNYRQRMRDFAAQTIGRENELPFLVLVDTIRDFRSESKSDKLAAMRAVVEIAHRMGILTDADVDRAMDRVWSIHQDEVLRSWVIPD